MVVSLSAGQLLVVWAAGDGPERTVRAKPATASWTRPGSAPVTVRTSRPSSCAAVARASAQARRGQRLGDGADGGVGGQRGLEVLAHRGDRDRGRPGRCAWAGRRARRWRWRPRPAVRPRRGGRGRRGRRRRPGPRRSAGRGGRRPRRRRTAGWASSAVLDDPGVDVVAAADDQVLGPAGEVDEAVGVDAAEVAGVQPAVTDDAFPAHPGTAETGVGDVAGEDGRAADHQFAELARRAARPTTRRRSGRL